MVEASSLLIGKVPVINFLVFLLLFFATLLLGNMMYLITRRFLDERSDKRTSKTIGRVLSYVIYVGGFYFGIVHVLGFDVTALLAAGTLIGIAVAFSAQQLVQNIISGIIIFATRIIRLEDWVEVGGFPQFGLARVKDISLFRTTLRTVDGKIVYVPNSTIITSNLSNYTKSEFVMIALSIKVSPHTDLQKVENIILSILDKHPKILPNVSNDTKSSLDRLLNIPGLSRFLEVPKNLKSLKPIVLIKNATKTAIHLEVDSWILEVQRKDHIISEIWNSVLTEFNKQKIEMGE